MALDINTGEIKWQLQTKYPPRISPLVTNDILFAGYIPFADNLKTGVILALDKETGDRLWESNVNAPIAPVGPSVEMGCFLYRLVECRVCPRMVLFKDQLSLLDYQPNWLDSSVILFCFVF